MIKPNKTLVFHGCFFLLFVLSLGFFIYVYVEGCKVSAQHDDIFGATMNFPIECFFFAPLFIGEIEAYRSLKYFFFQQPKSKVSTAFITVTSMLALLIMVSAIVARFDLIAGFAVIVISLSWMGVWILLLTRIVYGVVKHIMKRRGNDEEKTMGDSMENGAVY